MTTAFMEQTFAVIEHLQSYYDFYHELLSYLAQHFSDIESGIQGDAYIWITENDQKVAIDTFTAMQFEIKSDSKNQLLLTVIDIIKEKYPLQLI